MLVRTWSRDSAQKFKQIRFTTWHYIFALGTPRPQQNQWVMSCTQAQTVEDGLEIIALIERMQDRRLTAAEAAIALGFHWRPERAAGLRIRKVDAVPPSIPKRLAMPSALLACGCTTLTIKPAAKGSTQPNGRIGWGPVQRPFHRGSVMGAPGISITRKDDIFVRNGKSAPRFR